MNTHSRAEYHALVSLLSPPAVAEFLKSQGWDRVSRVEDVQEIWAHRQFRVMLPLATEYVDFEQRFGETLIALGRIYEWPPRELLERITTTRADVIALRLDHEIRGETIALSEADVIVGALRGIVESAAIRTVNPTSSGGGRKSGRVVRYMNENARFGHTRAGSFIFTVVSRWGSRDISPVKANASPEYPFAHRVAMTLARDLVATAEAVNQLRRGMPLNSYSSEQSLNPSVLKHLEKIGELPGLRGIEFSFTWSGAVDERPSRSTPITLDRPGLEQLSLLARTWKNLSQAPRTAASRMAHTEQERLELSPIESPFDESQFVELEGFVRSLSRHVGNASGGGIATVSVPFGERLVDISVALHEFAYGLAVEAHRQNIPVLIRGRIGRIDNELQLWGESPLDVEDIREKLN
ncbi:hypothetical protein [Streptomyces sp. AgN23]|uniref:hypothetical protein n=1 Tax=Streptomyces sp. AgN23 TaxID=1188315 RepID=UPI001B335AB0|nr:hypothetical protein [Streptomyces sp. AgN23]QTI88998.1 hypothetical protein AS97_51045 [Streptomyces sp. AgN23]